MALIKCEECGHMISDRAVKCPKCGAPIARQPIQPIQSTEPTLQPENDEPRSKRVWLLVALAIICCIIAGVFIYNHFQKGHPAEEQEVTETNFEAVDQTSTVGEDTISSRKIEAPSPSLTDLELTGFSGKVKSMELHPEYEKIWEYFFNEKGALISCKERVEGLQYHFNGNKLVSANGQIYREECIIDDDDDYDIVNYIYSYESDGDRHDVVYQTNTQTSQKEKFVDVYYDEKGRINKINRVRYDYGEDNPKIITYDDKNNPCDENGEHIMIGATLIGFPDIQRSNCKKSDSPHNDNRGHFDDTKHFASLEIDYWH